MTQREERLLTIGLGMFILVAVVGFLGYQFLFAPLRERDRRIAQLEEENRKADDRKFEILRKMPAYETYRKRSLPADQAFARREYNARITSLLRESGFPPNATEIRPLDPDTKNVPVTLPKKPIYTKLNYLVKTRGELASLVEFLEDFYRLGLLHHIRNLDVQRLPAGTNQRDEIDVSMNIEALVLDTAENRGTLRPVPLVGGPAVGLAVGNAAWVEFGIRAMNRGLVDPIEDLQVLARDHGEYDRIAGRNLFFGPPPPPKQDVTDERPKLDLTPYIRLTAITQTQGRSRAELFDFYNGHYYEIEQLASGYVTVKIFYELAGKKKRIASHKELVIMESFEDENCRFRVVRIDDRDLILQDLKPATRPDRRKTAALAVATVFAAAGSPLRAFNEAPALHQSTAQLYRWHVDELLKEVRPISSRELAAGDATAPPPRAVRTARGD